MKASILDIYDKNIIIHYNYFKNDRYFYLHELLDLFDFINKQNIEKKYDSNESRYFINATDIAIKKLVLDLNSEKFTIENLYNFKSDILDMLIQNHNLINELKYVSENYFSMRDEYFIDIHGYAAKNPLILLRWIDLKPILITYILRSSPDCSFYDKEKEVLKRLLALNSSLDKQMIFFKEENIDKDDNYFMNKLLKLFKYNKDRLNNNSFLIFNTIRDIFVLDNIPEYKSLEYVSINSLI